MKADALSMEEEEQLWTRGVLGGNNAVSLNHTVFFMLSQQFGTRGCQEHHQLRVEDLKFVCDPQGKTVYVEWVEGVTKTRQGGLKKMDCRLPQKIQKAKKPEQCRSSLPSTTPKATIRYVVFLSASRSKQNQLVHARNSHSGRTGLHQQEVYQP